MSRSTSKKRPESKAKTPPVSTTTATPRNHYPFPVPDIVLEVMEQLIKDEFRDKNKKLWCMHHGSELGHTADGSMPLVFCVLKDMLQGLRHEMRDIAAHKLPKLSMDSWHGVDLAMTIFVALAFTDAMFGVIQEAGVTYEYDPVVQRAVVGAMTVDGREMMNQ